MIWTKKNIFTDNRICYVFVQSVIPVLSFDVNQFTEIANNFMKHTLALENEDDVSNGLCVLRAAGLISSHLQIDLFAPIEPISIVKSQKKEKS